MNMSRKEIIAYLKYNATISGTSTIPNVEIFYLYSHYVNASSTMNAMKGKLRSIECTILPHSEMIRFMNTYNITDFKDGVSIIIETKVPKADLHGILKLFVSLIQYDIDQK